MDELRQLLRSAGDGDRLALSTFVRRTQAEVWRFCAGLIDVQSADDLTQEVYVRAMRAASAYRGEGSPRTWLLSIARRTCADEIRRRQRERRHRERLEQSARHEDPGVPDHAGHVELSSLLDHLDPKRREAFVLTQVLGLSYLEAAVAADVPVGTIRSRVSRAREDLVALLETPAEDEGLATS